MHSVNNCLSMSINSDTSEIALDKVKNILISFEKKKRNLEKRKNKLDEYKKKADLNEDQQAAVNKYPEVMSNLELLEELTAHAVQQLRDAEKSIKKIKKQEKIEKKRCETQLAEFVLRNYGVLERVGESEGVRVRAVREGLLSEGEVESMVRMFREMGGEGGGRWRRCGEQLQGLYEAAGGEGALGRGRGGLLEAVGRAAEAEWLWGECGEEQLCPGQEEHLEQHHEQQQEEDLEEGDGETVLQASQREATVEEHSLEPPVMSSPPAAAPKPENMKLSFVFLHDSVVQQDPAASKTNGELSEARPSSQASGGGSAAASQAWPAEESMADLEHVEDVFSSATQSEFMHSENAKNNAWAKGGPRIPLNGRFRGRSNVAPSSSFNSNKEGQPGDGNYWKTSRGAFNASDNPRFMRLARGRGRGRGGGRSDNRPISDALPAQ